MNASCQIVSRCIISFFPSWCRHCRESGYWYAVETRPCYRGGAHATRIAGCCLGINRADTSRLGIPLLVETQYASSLQPWRPVRVCAFEYAVGFVSSPYHDNGGYDG